MFCFWTVSRAQMSEMSCFVSGCVQSCPLVSGNGCYPSPGDPFSHNPALHQSLHSTLHLILLEFLTPNASITFLGKEDRHLPVRHGPLLASTMCRTLGQKNGILKSRTDMFSYPMRRGFGPTGQGQVLGALKGVTCRFRVLVVYEHTNSNTCLYTNNA